MALVMDQGAGALAARSVERFKLTRFGGVAIGIWILSVTGAFAADVPLLAKPISPSALQSPHHQQLQAIYDQMASLPYVYSPDEVDKAGERAMRLTGDARIYAMWHVLYSYKNDQDETNLIKWRDRVLALAHTQNDAALGQLAQFMYQAYRNEAEGFAIISDEDWKSYLATSDLALHAIVTLEKTHTDAHFGRVADAIDLGTGLINQLQGEGPQASALLLVSHQIVSYALVQVGDYNSYLQHADAMARLAKDNAFFSQKLDMLYDLAFEASREGDAGLAQKLQKLHTNYVNTYQIKDLVRWDEYLCAKVNYEVRDYRAVIGCLDDAAIAHAGPSSGLDVDKLKMLIIAYAATGDAARVQGGLERLNAAPKTIYPPRHDMLFETMVQAYLLRAQGRGNEAFDTLDTLNAYENLHNENVRVLSLNNLYQALRKELDRKSKESQLLIQQVKMQHMLFMAFFAIALLLGLLVSGGLMWVIRIRKMQWRLKEATDTAEAANEAKSRFLAVMSHELRTPLNGVLGMAQALHKQELAPQQKDQIGVLVDSGKTLMALLNDVLDMSRIEAGKVELMPANGTLKQMIERVIHTYAALAREKGLELRYDIADSAVPHMMFDALRVYQCLSNLVSNGLKFTETGSVTLIASAERKGDGGFRVRIEVRDTGIGMSKATMEKLFEAYSQGDPAAARKYGGAGLGLNISRQLAELMGGGLSVTSEEGKGSSFVMTFDAADAAVSEPEPPVEAETVPLPASTTGKTILLVDDHPVNRRVARLFLEPFNFVITEAVDGQEALDADMSKFDLVLMDLNMPRMGGLEATRIFRAGEARGRHVPIVALTADAMKDQIEACYAAGMDAHISKPILMDKLIETVSSLLEGPDDALAQAG